MSDPIITDSDSDLDTNSSWTFLAEESSNKNEHDEQTKNEPTEVIESPQNNVEVSNPNIWPDNNDVESISSTSSIESVHSIAQSEIVEEPSNNSIPFNDFRDFHDFHDFHEFRKEDDLDDQASHWEQQVEKTKSRKRKYKKLRTEQVSTAKVIGAVLSLAGLSFVCMLAPYMTRQFATTNLENKLEKNFTKIDSQYAKNHGYQVYIENSDEAKTVCRKPETLEAFAKQCCLTHINSKSKPTKRCARCSRDQPALQKILNNAKGIKNDCEIETKNKDFCLKNEKPSYLNENCDLKEREIKGDLMKKKGIQETEIVEIIDLTNDDDDYPSTEISNEKNQNKKKEPNMEKKSMKKSVDNNKNNEMNVILPQETINVKSINEKCPNNNLNDKKFQELKVKKKSLKKVTDNPKEFKELKPKIEDITKPINKSKSKYILETSLKESKKVTKKAETLTKGRKIVSEPKSETKQLKSNIKSSKNPTAKSKNSLKNEQTKSTLGFSKLETMEIQPTPNVNKQFPDNVFRPYCLSQLKPEIVQCSSNIDDASKSKTEAPQIPNHFRCDYMACQLLQDIALLKITGKMKSVAQKRQKKLKRRIETRKLRLMKNSGGESESEEEKKTRKPLKPSTTQKISIPTFVTTKKPSEINLPKCNDVFLKELPFGKKPASEGLLPNVIIDEPKVKMHEKQSITNKGVKSLASLIELSKKQKDKLRQLEQMKRENQIKLDAMLKDRKCYSKKDACLGYYNIPMPEYENVSEQLQKLKGKPSSHVGFICDSSDSESEKNCSFKSIENRVSAELMAALKVGKKVSDSFKEWTLKKAPTLTCLKKYCNDKVSHITDRLAKPSTSEYQYLAIQERHEKLVNYWNSKKEYFDKRIEICNLLKDKLSDTGSMGEITETSKSISQGVHILDTIIADVLKTVKSSDNLREHSDKVEIETKRACQSVSNINKPMNVIRRSKADLYRWLFDKNGMTMMKRDNNSFATTVRENLLNQNKREVSKQDPSKSFHERFLKKHN